MSDAVQPQSFSPRGIDAIAAALPFDDSIGRLWRERPPSPPSSVSSSASSDSLLTTGNFASRSFWIHAAIRGA